MASEDAPTREESITRCRARALTEAEAFRRLGYPIELDEPEEIIDWTMPWWLIPDSLIPTPPALIRVAVARMDEVAAEVDAFLHALPAAAWDRDPGDGWTLRRTLDHVAGAFGIGLRRLEPWPLDPDRAQTEAAAELVARVSEAGAESVEQVGPNEQPSRVHWTPRKVLRNVRRLQEAWLSHVVGNAREPLMPFDDDAPGDDLRPTADEINGVLLADAELRRHAQRNARAVAPMYRYYRDRLVRWPVDAFERWQAMRVAFRGRLLALDEAELALIRVTPSGQCHTVRTQLALGLSHVREHLDQMKEASRLTS